MFIGLAFLVLALPSPADAPKPDRVENDLSRFEGVWKAESMILDGTEVAKADFKDHTWTIKAGRWTFSDGQGHKSESQIKMDATKSPRTIDVTHVTGPLKGMRFEGIYKFEGRDRVIICHGQTDRPGSFKSEAGTLVLLEVLIRQK